MLFLPPRHGKSELATIHYAAYRLLVDQSLRVIIGAYNHSLACTFSRQTRRIAKEFGFSFSDDQNKQNQWSSEHGGGLYAVGVGSGVTGYGADCLPAGTLINTKAGLIPIENIEIGSETGMILTKGKNSLEYKTAKAIASRQESWLYRITTHRGRVVEATGNHRFYVSGDYRKASELSPGDPLLLCVQKADYQDRFRIQEVGKDGGETHRLQQGLQKQVCGDISAWWPTMREMRAEKRATVFRYVQEVFLAATGSQNQEQKTSVSGCRLRAMQCPIRCKCTEDGRRGSDLPDLLRKRMCGQRSLQKNVGGKQSQVEARCDTFKGTTALCEGVPSNETKDPCEGQQDLCGMQEARHPHPCSPHRQLADEQCGIESGVPLRVMPREDSQGVTFETSCDSVAVVERIRKDAVVYDIEVEDNHNFFANGILCHNCIIIDDPVKSRAEAESPTYRARVMDWYQNDLYTRLHPGASIVLIMTRWHSLDLAGQLLEQANDGGEQWEVVSLPAIAEEHDLIGRQPGEALWPDRYSVEDFDRIKKTVGSYAFSALYQQTPTPRDGGFFKPEWFKIVEPAPIPPNSNLCRAWDTAATVGGGDYTAGVWMVRTGDTYRVKHVSRGQWSPAQRRTVQRQIAETDGRETIVHLAQDPGSAGVDQVQHDTRNLIGYGVISKRPTGSKEVRAMPMAAAFESGSIELERGDWNRDFIDELCSFPTGKHDDQVDAAADAFSYLSPIQPFRYVS